MREVVRAVGVSGFSDGFRLEAPSSGLGRLGCPWVGPTRVLCIFPGSVRNARAGMSPRFGHGHHQFGTASPSPALVMEVPATWLQSACSCRKLVGSSWYSG